MVVGYRTSRNFYLFRPYKLLPLPQHIVTYIDSEILQYLYLDLCEHGVKKVGNLIFMTVSTQLRVLLPIITSVGC